MSFPDREFEGTVRTVGSRVDPVTRAITVRALIENADRALRPGMLLTVEVVTAERNALVVPESAVFQVQNRAYVYLADGDTARQQQIDRAAEKIQRTQRHNAAACVSHGKARRRKLRAMGIRVERLTSRHPP